MKRLAFLWILLFPLCLAAQNQIPEILNLGASYSFTNDRLTIGFDVADNENDTLEITLQLSDDGGQTFQLDASTAMGDIGYPIMPGTGKAIYWDAPSNIFSPLLRVRVIVDDRQPFDIQAVVDQVDSARLKQDLTYFGQNRHRDFHLSALEAIQDSLALRMTEMGLAVRQQTQSFQGYDAANIIGRQWGHQRPDQVYMIDAHYDAVPNVNGADDNGSGVVGFLEAARVLSPYVSTKSVQYIGFDLEEAGLLGSIAYLTTADGIPASDTLLGVFNFEMIGYYDNAPNSQSFPTGFNLLFPAAYNASQADGFRGNFLSSVGNQNSNPLRESLDSCAALYVPDLNIISIEVAGNGLIAPDLRRSDHAPFWDAGYQALMLTDGANFRNPNYHTAGDSLATLNFTFMRQNVQAVVATIAKMAQFRHASQVTESVAIQNVGIEKLGDICSFVLTNTDELIQIRWEDCQLGRTRLGLLDLRGKTVLRSDWGMENSPRKLILGDLPNGLYLALLESEKGIYLEKIFLLR